MSQFLITSEYDSNYFIVNSEVYSIAVLSTMLAEVNIDLANILLSIMDIEKSRNNLLFISKSSQLGIELNKLIKENCRC